MSRSLLCHGSLRLLSVLLCDNNKERVGVFGVFSSWTAMMESAVVWWAAVCLLAASITFPTPAAQQRQSIYSVRAFGRNRRASFRNRLFLMLRDVWLENAYNPNPCARVIQETLPKTLPSYFLDNISVEKKSTNFDNFGKRRILKKFDTNDYAFVHHTWKIRHVPLKIAPFPWGYMEPV